MNEIYNAGLITLGPVATSMASKKITKDDLGVSNSAQGTLKLAAAVGGGALLVKFLQKKDYVPKQPFKASNFNKKMASVLAGGLFNAVAFSGAGYVFHKLDKSGYEEEMKRHNEAMEKLSKAKEKWYEKRWKRPGTYTKRVLQTVIRNGDVYKCRAWCN